MRVVKPRHISRNGSAVKPVRNSNWTGQNLPGTGECGGGCRTAKATPILIEVQGATLHLDQWAETPTIPAYMRPVAEYVIPFTYWRH